ncbi:MAG: DUF1499 domain-containing protein [Cypionkella sp.]
MIFSKGLGLVVLVIFFGLNAYVRLAPIPQNLAQLDLTTRPAPMGPVVPDQVTTFENGAYADLSQASLERLDAVALATPRTHRVAGSVAEGRIIWETRSLVWGFPDYTIAQTSGSGLTILARSRYGSGDWGVNGKRLLAWIAAL